MPTPITASSNGTPNISGFITAARAKNVPDSQIYSYLQNKGYLKPVSSTTKSLDMGNNIAQGTTDSKSLMDQQASSGANQINEGITDIGKGAPGKNPIIGGVEDALKVGSGIVNVATSPLAGAFKPVSDMINKAGNVLADTPLLQAYGEDTASLPANEQTTPERITQDASNAGNIAGGILGADQVVKTIPKGVEAVKTTAGDIKHALTPKDPPDGGGGAAAVKTAKQLQGVANDWAKPTTINKPGYAKPTTILKNNPDIPQFLAKQGLNPAAHIEDGRYNTADTAEALRDTAAKMSHDTLRPSLQLADYITPKIPIKEIVDSAIKRAKADIDTTEGDKQGVINSIQKEGTALQEKHPDGIGLTDMHDSKITYAKNAGYSPIKDPAANLKATANRSLASALQQAVEKNAPENVPVKDVNNYFSKYYKAADYLDSLNNKNAPVSISQHIARGAAKFGGAAIGAKFGGGVVSEFAGYQIGKALEHAAENLSNPMRASFLSNLEKTNPEAFNRVQNYLRSQAQGNAGTLRLPAPRAIQLPAHDYLRTSPHQAGPSMVKSVQAPKGPVGINRQTGKFASTYRSSPE